MSISILWRHIFIAADKDHFLAHPETSLTVNVKKKIWSRCNFFFTQIPPAYEKSIRNSSSDHVNSKILGREPNFNIWRIEICALPAQSPLQESIYFAFFFTPWIREIFPIIWILTDTTTDCNAPPTWAECCRGMFHQLMLVAPLRNILLRLETRNYISHYVIHILPQCRPYK